MSAPNRAAIQVGVQESAYFVYRGIHAQHPAFGAALEGRAVPGNPLGAVTPELHNDGGHQADSPFTSWTHNYDVARRAALRFGPGGVILRLPVGAPEAGEAWSWVYSPDEFWEDEILLRGVRSGATVEML
jgi:hypothetical protein